MLEGRTYEHWQDAMQEEEYIKGYCMGIREGALEVLINFYREIKRSGHGIEEFTRNEIFKSREILSEYEFFYEQYGHFSSEKQAEHMLIESEYLLECL